MKKILIAVVALALVAGAVFFGTKFTVKPKEVITAEILPDDIAFYYSIQNIEAIWKDISSSKFWKRFSGLRIWNDLQSNYQAFLKRISGLSFFLIVSL